MDAKILIADDSAFMRKVLIDILQGIGATNISEAENGKQAVEKVEAESPDLLLLDIIMPEMDGIEVLKAIGSKTKVIIISAVGQEGIIEEAKNNGALGFIVKPFDNTKVEEEIKKVLA